MTEQERVLRKGWSMTLKRLKPVLIPLILALTLTVAFGVQAAKTAGGKHFIWSVETGKNTIYLLGSIHVLKRDSYPLAQAIEEAYGCCKKVVFETDLDGMKDAASQSKMLSMGLYPEGETLSQSISQDTIDLIEKRGLPIIAFERFKPWFVALSVTVMEFQKLGLDPTLGLDQHFYNRAKKDGRALDFLETNEFQLNIMAEMDNDQQEAFLRETLKELEVIEEMAELEVIEEMADDMLEAWKYGDSDKLYSIIKIGFDEHPDIYDRFFLQRNRNWAEKLQEMSKDGEDMLVIVGAGHLVGEGSLIELLKKKGYKVKQR
jgi:uncharacterized protein YbaP (TraB family)